MRFATFVAFGLWALSTVAATTKNDDSCDVMVAPAATLLLPYFEVDLAPSAAGETTLFTVTNVAQLPQIAHVTIWTDWSFPVLDFNLFLTGYDAQSINLYDVIARGRIAEPGTTSDAPTGRRSSRNFANPLLDLTNCNRLGAILPSFVLEDVQRALTQGTSSRCAQRIGGRHVRAVGYVTVDVVASCGAMMPTDPQYATTRLLYDNVLSGDYQQVNVAQNFAQAGPMVHIRAFPEGGAPGAKTTNLSRTFYSNFHNGGTADRRQPLPALFAARWIEGGATAFATTYKIWREGRVRGNAGCDVDPNGRLGITDVVRFDEDENATVLFPCEGVCPPIAPPALPATARVGSNDTTVFPPNPDARAAGWMYMNLDHGSVIGTAAASQNWVVVSMAAEGRYSVDFDAALLGNGCSPQAALTDRDGGRPAIGPASADDRTFASGSPSTTSNDDSCDIMPAPAATLLLPSFEVDVDSPLAATTLFTVTNVTRLPQIAHVTLWTDLSYPVLSFDLFLTGYDVQSINLHDVIVRGVLPGTTSRVATGGRSAPNGGNPLLDISSCGTATTSVPPQVADDLLRALTFGRSATCGNAQVGGRHARAIGFATIDVVQRCNAGLPSDPAYFAANVLYENVLIGDYQQVRAAGNFAQGNPMVHIRAIPEGGTPGTGSAAFARTFYSHLQNGGTSDRRQPLPSLFAARWIDGGPTTFATSFKIWREGVTGAAGCGVTANGNVDVVESVRFDEKENPTTLTPDITVPRGGVRVTLPSSSIVLASSSLFPPITETYDVAGWLYINLDSSESPQTAATQGWVVVSMAAEGRYSADFDALSLANGCTAAVPLTDEDGRAPAIAPGTNP